MVRNADFRAALRNLGVSNRELCEQMGLSESKFYSMLRGTLSDSDKEQIWEIAKRTFEERRLRQMGG